MRISKLNLSISHLGCPNSFETRVKSFTWGPIILRTPIARSRSCGPDHACIHSWSRARWAHPSFLQRRWYRASLLSPCQLHSCLNCSRWAKQWPPSRTLFSIGKKSSRLMVWAHPMYMRWSISFPVLIQCSAKGCLGRGIASSVPKISAKDCPVP